MSPNLHLLDFIATEATHDDFYTMTELQNANLTYLIDELGKNCSLNKIDPLNESNVPVEAIKPSEVFSDSYFANNMVIDEKIMDEVLLGEPRKDLCQYKNWKPITVRSINYADMGVSGISAEIRHIAELIGATNDDTDAINDMFSQVVDNSNGKKDIYFVCDSASEVIKKFSKNEYFPANINMHVMISSATLADPATQMKEANYKLEPKQGNKYIHTYVVPINLEKCDKFGLLDFKITHQLKRDYTVKEIFEYTGQGNNNIPRRRVLDPSHEKTTKHALKSEIEGKSKILGLRIAQYKRMGDHQQIRFIRWLWNRQNFQKRQTLYHLNSVGEGVVPLSTLQSTLQSFTRPDHTNCFFVTGDYPAFEYAIFHRINAIIKTNSSSSAIPRGLLMVRFN